MGAEVARALQEVGDDYDQHKITTHTHLHTHTHIDRHSYPLPSPRFLSLWSLIGRCLSNTGPRFVPVSIFSLFLSLSPCALRKAVICAYKMANGKTAEGF